MEKKYLPLIVVEIYLGFSLLLFKTGVWNFAIPNEPYFYTYIGLFHIAFILGYLFSINKKRTLKVRTVVNFSSSLITTLLITNIFMILLNSFRLAGITSLSGGKILTQIMQQISNPAIGYYNKFNVSSANLMGGQLGTIILFAWGFCSMAVIPLGFYFWKKMSAFQRFIFVINVIVTLVGALLSGTNKKIFDLIIAFLTYIWLKNKGKGKLRIKYIVLIFLIVILGAFIFSYFVGSRKFGGYWYKSYYRLGGSVYLNQNSIFFKILPPSLLGTAASITSYLCQGYYGFALTYGIKLPLMFGTGSSLYLVDKFDLNQRTYQYAIEQQFGWNSRVQWASVYTWIANDVGKIGTILVMFFIGYFFAKLYFECKIQNNPVSFVLMTFMVTTLVFIPCNLQIFQDISGIEGTFLFVMLWIAGHIFRKEGNYEEQVITSKRSA